MDDPLRLGALLSACALCDAAMPERESHTGIFNGFLALLDTLGSDSWSAAYIVWEIALLRELGFSLDFSCCASSGDRKNLYYMSPKSGRAVSKDAGKPYKDRLLPLPDFLKPGGKSAAKIEILKGLQMTGYFYEHWVFNHHSKGVPEDRLRFEQRFAKTVPSHCAEKINSEQEMELDVAG